MKVEVSGVWSQYVDDTDPKNMFVLRLDYYNGEAHRRIEQRLPVDISDLDFRIVRGKMITRMKRYAGEPSQAD